MPILALLVTRMPFDDQYADSKMKESPGSYCIDYLSLITYFNRLVTRQSGEMCCRMTPLEGKSRASSDAQFAEHIPVPERHAVAWRSTVHQVRPQLLFNLLRPATTGAAGWSNNFRRTNLSSFDNFQYLLRLFPGGSTTVCLFCNLSSGYGNIRLVITCGCSYCGSNHQDVASTVGWQPERGL